MSMARAYKYLFASCPFHPPVEIVDTETGPHDLSPIMGYSPTASMFFVVCPVCQCQGPLADNAEGAMDLWNKVLGPGREQ